MADRSEYEYHVVTERLKSPIRGIYHYAAKVSVTVKLKKGGARRVSPDIGEMWGATQDDAHDRMERAVEKWIDERP